MSKEKNNASDPRDQMVSVFFQQREDRFFSKNHRIFLGILLCFFAVQVLLGTHGFSISAWHEYIDGSEKEEILIGKVQGIRSDDWAVEIPMMLSQIRHDPSFPLINEDIGAGANMLTHSRIPVKHPLTFFRPTTWGFFLGGDTGLAWIWWMLILGGLYVYFLVFMLISRNDFFLSVTGSIFLIFSPFFQFWSLHKMEIPLFAGVIFVSFCYLLLGSDRRTIIGNGLLLGWAMSCFTINFLYPPYQVACAYLLLFMIAGFIAERFSEIRIAGQWGSRLSALAAAIAIFLLVGIGYYYAAKEVIAVMMNSVYPGNRFCIGGDYTAGGLFRQAFLSPFFMDVEWEQIGANICEGSSFLFFFPPIVLLLFWRSTLGKKMTDRFSWFIVGYFLLFLIYFFIGFHPTLSRYTLFYQMQTNRALIGLGIANVALMISFLSHSRDFSPAERIVPAVVWGIILIIAGSELKGGFQELSGKFVVTVAISNALFIFYLLREKERKTMMTLLAGFSIISTVWFNPMVVRGTEFIEKNPLSQKILEIDQGENGDTNWAAFGMWVYPNLFRMLGVDAVNGTHPYPQLELWEPFDREERFISEYNRFAHVTFQPLSAVSPEVRFHSPSPDQLIVSFYPGTEILERFGITHLLVTGEYLSSFEHRPEFEKLYTYAGKVIFGVNTKIGQPGNPPRDNDGK